MQDKPNTDVDRQFTDQAWEAMRKMLDAEMPVETKGPRLVWLWLLLGILALGGGSAWYFGSAEQPAKTTDTTEKPVAAIAPAAQPEETARSLTPTEIPLVAPGSQSGNTPAEVAAIWVETPADVTNPQARIEYGSPSASQAKKTEEMQGTMPVKTSPVLAEIPAEPGVQDPLVAPAATTPAPATAQRNHWSPQTPLANLALLPVSGTQYPDQLPVTAAKIRKPNKVSWEISAGLLSHQLAAVDGFSAGIGAVYSLAGQRWTLRSGLQYRFHRLPFEKISSSKALSSDEQSGNPLTNAGTTVISDPNQFFNGALDASVTEYVLESSQQQVNLTLKTHYVDLPLVVEYRPTKKIGFAGGARLSYLLTSFWGVGGVSQSIVTDPNAPVYSFDQLSAGSSNRSWYQSAADNRTDASVTRRFDLAFTGGISFYPTSRLGLRLEYDHGLKNILQSDDFQLRNRSLRISARYLFVR